MIANGYFVDAMNVSMGYSFEEENENEELKFTGRFWYVYHPFQNSRMMMMMMMMMMRQW